MKLTEILNYPLVRSSKFICFCAPSPPPAPDYVGAAEEQGRSNIEATRTGARLNNPNVVSPYGTQTVTYGGGFDQAGYDTAMQQYQRRLDDAENVPWFGSLFQPEAPDRMSFYRGDPDIPTVRQTFSPEQQAIFDQSNRIKLMLGGLGEQGAEAMHGLIGTPVDFSGAPAMPGNATDTRNKVIDAMMSRVNYDTNIARENKNSELIAAGIRPGNQAYDDQMHLIDRAYNDARNQAFLSSGQEAQRDFGMDAERRRQAITEMLSQRQIPLNEITALLSGSQVSNPFALPGYAQNNQVQPAPTFAGMNALAGYNTDVFNAEAAGAANQQAGAMGLGGAGLMAAAMFF